jgi:hypothetical protein
MAVASHYGKCERFASGGWRACIINRISKIADHSWQVVGIIADKKIKSIVAAIKPKIKPFVKSSGKIVLNSNFILILILTRGYVK